MQQRQLRLGDILDDYCPRERRVTNHAVVAMIGEDVKQTRCTTCDADHEYKHAKVPRQRRKDTPAALSSQVPAGGPKRVVHDATRESRKRKPSKSRVKRRARAAACCRDRRRPGADGCTGRTGSGAGARACVPKKTRGDSTNAEMPRKAPPIGA